MSLNVVHATIDEIPEAFRELYSERDGKFHLTGISGMKSQADIDRLSNALNMEKSDHAKVKEKLRLFDGLDADEVRKELLRIPELEVMAKGNKEEFETKLEELTEARVKSRLAPVELELKRTKESLEATGEELSGLQSEKRRRTVTDEINKHATESKVQSTALADVMLLGEQVFDVTEDGQVITKENQYGITPGIGADVFIQELKEKRPHYWPVSNGGGAKGSGAGGNMGNNPWSGDNWSVTEQGKVIAAQGMDKAKQMASSAGVDVFATSAKAKS